MSLNDPQGKPGPEVAANPSEPARRTELAARRESNGPGDHPEPHTLPTYRHTPDLPRARRGGRLLPMLFVATCASTFLVGCMHWRLFGLPFDGFLTIDGMLLRRSVIEHWRDGLIYMACVMAILLTHEMGHYLTAVFYRIPATPPIFIPLPISPIGTMGAVIGMKGMKANRRQIFDIGIAGPLAGLVVAMPILWFGISRLDLTGPGLGTYRLDLPVAARGLMALARPGDLGTDVEVWQDQVNPFLMAGWVGLLVTGLNMLPVSQLDGGHVAYSLLGRKAHWIARVLMLAVVSMIAIDWICYFTIHRMVLHVGDRWWLMAVLILLMGTDHPPTRDDSVSLGWFRTILGAGSLLIPILCFPPRIFFFT